MGNKFKAGCGKVSTRIEYDASPIHTKHWTSAQSRYGCMNE